MFSNFFSFSLSNYLLSPKYFAFSLISFAAVETFYSCLFIEDNGISSSNLTLPASVPEIVMPSTLLMWEGLNGGKVSLTISATFLLNI